MRLECRRASSFVEILEPFNKYGDAAICVLLLDAWFGAKIESFPLETVMMAPVVDAFPPIFFPLRIDLPINFP